MFSIRVFLIAMGAFSVIAGVSNLMSNTTPVICSISDIEKGSSDFSKYDYFKISGGRTIGYYFYSRDQTTGRIVEVVYPIFSDSVLDSVNKVYKSSPGYSENKKDGLLDWITRNRIKPAVFVYSNLTPENVAGLDSAADTLDNKLVAGTRITKLIDMGRASTDVSSEIKDKVTQSGYDIDNAIIIRQGAEPSNNTTFGWWAVICGLILACWLGYFEVKKVIAAFKPKGVQQKLTQ